MPHRDMPCSTLHYLGHAGFVAEHSIAEHSIAGHSAAEHSGVRVLIDPWFHPAFLDAWFPYPDNRPLLDEVQGGRFDYLYISHTHEDHFDERVLRTLDRSVTVLVPRFRSKALVKRFTALGFDRLVVLDHRESLELAPGLTATMFLDTSHKEDSGLLLDLGGFRFLDLNDCNTPMSELPGDIDLLAAQYSGAMWYPNCYDYPAEVMRQKVAAVRRDLMDTLHRKVQLTGARAYLPSAGPVCFLDPELDRYNDRDATIFPIWEDVAADFTAAYPDVAVPRIHAGDDLVLDPAARSFTVVSTPLPPQAWDLDSYRERRREEWSAFHADPVEPITPAEIEAYFATLQRLNKRLLTDFRKDIRLVAGGARWDVALGRLAETFVIEGEEPYEAEYTLRMAPRVLRAVLDGRAGWEEALLSMRLSLHRDPDVFDVTFMSLLRYGNQPAQTMQMVRERENRETIERDGLRVQRFCPHAGEDLALATVCNGVLECPRHHWKWNAATGECIEGGAIDLRVEVLDTDSPALSSGSCPDAVDGVCGTHRLPTPVTGGS